MQTALGHDPGDLKVFQDDPKNPAPAHGVLVKYKDGTRGLALKLSNVNRWAFGCRIKGDPQVHATTFNVGPWQNRNLFKALAHAVQSHIIHRKAPYPVERTLLVTGILDAEMHSRFEKGVLKDTPELAIAYQPVDYRAVPRNGR